MPRSGHRSRHMRRATSPCSLLTPLACADVRSASTGIENLLPCVGSGGRPNARIASVGTSAPSRNPRRYHSTRGASNTSLPAGTGVCVANTADRRVVATAADQPSAPFVAIAARARSSAKNAECPSFMWNTLGRWPSVASARTPPTPSNTSCLTRTSASPPYSRAVIARSPAEFSGTFASSRNRGTRPTWTRHTCARSARSANSRCTFTGLPAVSATKRIGRVAKSIRG